MLRPVVEKPAASQDRRAVEMVVVTQERPAAITVVAAT